MDEILNLIESLSGEFPSYSYVSFSELIMRILVPFNKMYRIRHLLGFSVCALNEELERYVKYSWNQTLTRKNVTIDGQTEERVSISDSNDSIFIDIETFLKQLDQGHLSYVLLEDLLREIRRVLSSI